MLGEINLIQLTDLLLGSLLLQMFQNQNII